MIDLFKSRTSGTGRLMLKEVFGTRKKQTAETAQT